MKLLVEADQLDLALAVFTHREWVASTVGSITSADGTAVDLGRLLPSLSYWAMDTNMALRDHAQVQRIYERAISQGVAPTNKMTNHYLRSLVFSQKYPEALALYRQSRHHKRPMDRQCYQAMLRLACSMRNSALAQQLVRELKDHRFNVDIVSYFNVIASFDDKYYLLAGERNAEGKPTWTRVFCRETYPDCVTRIAEQDAQPAKYAQAVAASRQVLEWFDEMPNEAHEEPDAGFFPRVLAASMFLHQYDQVAKFMAHYKRVCASSSKLVEVSAVRIATNALLLQNEPAAAWEFVLDTYASVFDDPLPTGERTIAASTLTHVVAYLKMHGDTALTKQLVATLHEQGRLQSALSQYSRRSVINTIVRDTTGTNDEEVWQIVCDYARVFPVLDDPAWLFKFVELCARTGRWSLIVKAIHARDKQQIALLAPELAHFVSHQLLTDKKNPRAANLRCVAQLPEMVAVDAFTKEEMKVAFGCNVIRAMGILKRRDDRKRREEADESDAEREFASQQLGIRRIHDQFLSGASEIPEDVQEIVKWARAH